MTPTTGQRVAQSDAVKARAGLRATEREALEVAASVAEGRRAGADVAALEGRHRDLLDRLAADRATLAEARARVLPGDADVAAGADPIGADLLERALPVVLLPLRLETHYVGDRLLVRIYPDTVHANGHEPELTPRERGWLAEYRKRLAASADRPPWVAAWRDLVARVGVHRALYLATLDRPRGVGSRPSAWSRAAEARLLPDRFVAHVWTSTGARIRATAKNPVREPLPLGPDPSRGDPADRSLVGEEASWLHDFAAALQAGMALEVPLGAMDVTVSRLVVLGVRASVDADAQAEELAAQLAAHRFTNSVDLLPPGTPSNALPGARPAYTARPDPEAVYEHELEYALIGATLRRRPPHHMRPTFGGPPNLDTLAAGYITAQALGIDPEVLGYTPGSGDIRLAQEGIVRAVLRMAFERQIVRGLGTAFDPAAVAAMLDVMQGAVSALGPYPTLMLGTQPYGLLPVMLPDPARMDASWRAARTMQDALRALVFEAATSRVARVGRAPAGDPAAALLEILRSDAIVRQLSVRPVFDGGLAGEARGALARGVVTALDRARLRVVRLLTSLGVAGANDAAVTDWVLAPEPAAVTAPLAAPPDATGSDDPQVWVNWLRTLTLDEILAEGYPDRRPNSLLFELCRAAVLEAADADARETLVADGGVAPSDFEDASSAVGTPRKRLATPAPRDPGLTLAERLSPRNVAEAQRTWAVFSLLGELMLIPAASLEMLVAGALGVFVHRLDAWYTGYAAASLQALRSNPAPGRPTVLGFQTGLGIGGFGWLEDIPRKAGAARSAGFVLAPSQQHGAAAGVLLSSDLAHRTLGHGNAYAVDLSSTRVRAALELLDGTRTQPIAALLGYRIERALVERGGTAPALIARLRQMAPLTTPRVNAGNRPADTVAADHVVDGLWIVEQATDEGRRAPVIDPLRAGLGTLDQQQEAALLSAVTAAADAVDAVADVLLAEGVYQLVGGTPTRAGAVTDAASGAFVPPPEPAVVRTPIRGVGTTHRVIVAVQPGGGGAAGWNSTPRAQAEPLLDLLYGRLLPGPSRIWIRARYTDAMESTTLVEATLATLLAQAAADGRAELGLAALDVVAGLDDLEARVAALIGASQTPAVDAEAIELVAAPAAGWTRDRVSFRELMGMARACRGALGPARALRSSDLPVPANVDVDEVTARLLAAQSDADAAAAELTQALAEGASAEARARALYRAGQYGVRVRPDASTLRDQVRTAGAELATRLAASRDLTRPEVERLAALFGPGFTVVPQLRLGSDALETAFSEDIGATPAAVRAFIARTARVRERVNRLDLLLAFVDAHGAAGAYAFAAAQRPLSTGERWTALPGPVVPGRTSWLALTTGADTAGAGQVIAGLFLDDWNDVVPATDAAGSVAFHFDAPSSAAPNAFLLCVPDPALESWSEDGLLAHVVEALALARLRAVDPDHLVGVGQLLPALVLSDGAFQNSLAETVTVPRP